MNEREQTRVEGIIWDRRGLNEVGQIWRGNGETDS